MSEHLRYEDQSMIWRKEIMMEIMLLIMNHENRSCNTALSVEPVQDVFRMCGSGFPPAQPYLFPIWQGWILRRWTRRTNRSFSERSTLLLTHWRSPLAMCKYYVITGIAIPVAYFTSVGFLSQSNCRQVVLLFLTKGKFLNSGIA